MTSSTPSAGEGLTRCSRRAFVKTSALAAAAGPWLGGLLAAPLAGQGQTAAPSSRIRLGLIGCGGMGRGDLDAFLLLPEVDCAVVCDPDEAQMGRASQVVESKRGHKPDRAADFRRVLERKDVDAVIVATPDHWHALPTVLACQAGKDVYVEKPLALTIGEGRAMVAAMQKHGRVAQMGTQRRSSTMYREAADFVKSGKLGKVGTVRAWAYLDWINPIGKPADAPPPDGVDYDLWLGPASKRPFNPNRFHFNFRWFWDYAGGLMTDWGVHLIDVLLMAMGHEPPRSVASLGGKYVLDDNSETPDTQITIYEFPTYNLVWEHKVGVGVGLNGRPWGMSFTGSDGTLIINDSGWEVLIEKRKANLDPFKKPGGADPRPDHVRNFIECMKSRQQPVQHLENGHFVSTVAHLGNLALRVGRKLNWDAARELVKDDAEANRLVTARYRQPWTLPYLPTV
jgi:predicted dehydrogenase